MKKKKTKSEYPQTECAVVKNGKVNVFNEAWIHPTLHSFNGEKVKCVQAMCGTAVVGFDVFIDDKFICYIHTINHTQSDVYKNNEALDFGSMDYM